MSNSKYTCFELVYNDTGVTEVIMNRPDEFNSMTRSFWRELPEIMTDLSRDNKTRVAVLWGQGKHFCAGMHLGNFSDGHLKHDTKDRSRLSEMQRMVTIELQDSISSLEKARIPVIAAIQGACIGGGVDLATAADLRYTTANAWFCVQEINIGMAADVGTLQRLPKIIPAAVAKEMCYTGERVGAERAQELGLVNRVFETQEDLLKGVMEIAETIAKKSPLAVTSTKVLLNHARDNAVDVGLEYTALWNSAMLSNQDLMQGIKSHMDKSDEAGFEDLIELKKYWDIAS